MDPPATCPWMGRLVPGFESWMVPFSFDPDWCQRRVNVPREAPLYRPDPFPHGPPARPYGARAAGAGPARGFLPPRPPADPHAREDALEGKPSPLAHRADVGLRARKQAQQNLVARHEQGTQEGDTRAGPSREFRYDPLP